jgi:ArsR family transcriptional regulator
MQSVGLVMTRREGRQIIYRLSDERIMTLLALMREIAESHIAKMERLLRALYAGDDTQGAL